MFDQQDDAVAYGVHASKRIHDLYLYDYKALVRLTDVTYEKVINGDNIAFVLFTLECENVQCVDVVCPKK